MHFADNNFDIFKQIDSLTSGFVKLKFPVLERLVLRIEERFNFQPLISTNQICQFILKFPKLRSTQFQGETFRSEAYRKLALQFCKERDIFICFGKYVKYQWSDTKYQIDFEKNIERDPIVKSKYDNLKKDFLIWNDFNKFLNSFVMPKY